MKRALISVFIIILSFSIFAFKMAETMASGVLEKLGMSEEFAKDCIWSSFSGGYLSHPGGATLRQTAANERGMMVREVGEYAKNYSRSEEFKKKYAEYREGRRPTLPEEPKSMAQQRQEQKEQLQKSIRETEENSKSMSADQQEMMRGMVNMFKEQLKALDDPNNQMFGPEMEKMLKESHAAAIVEYKQKLAKWETDYPASPNGMIKHWLTEFLDVSKDIDFHAALIPGDGGKKHFAKPEYERKPENWKLCFRAGKETVDAGRAFARQWIEELNKAR